MSDIFISYSRATAKEAQRVADALRALGYGVWRDEQIPAHRAYSDVIEERLHAAKAVLVVWSAEAARSEWVRSEAESARAGHKLIQLTIDGAKLPMPFDQIECANLVGWNGDPDAPGWRKVVSSVAELTGTRVDLGRAPDFLLGDVVVSPSALRLRNATAEWRVEPRVMEVLVVLARNASRTVSRDQLIEACWEGRIVSDDAVNRVIAQVRALARSIEPAPFELQTVPKVGFRLISAGAQEAAKAPAGSLAPATTARGRPPRRGLIAAGAALVVLVLGGVLAWRFIPHGAARPPGQNGRVDVMMFTAQGSDPTLPKIAENVSSSLVGVLSGASVQVAERPLARDAAGSDAELRVAGSVERDQDNYAVIAQILDRRSGIVLWSDRLVQTALDQQFNPGRPAATIAAVLHCALEDRKITRTAVSTEAFGLYLNACGGVFGNYGSGRMLAVTRRLVKVAPQFAGAHAMHAIAAANAAWDAERAPTEAAALHAEAKAAAGQALKLDPNTPKAYAGLALNEGALANGPRHNWYLVEQYALKALKIDPDLPPARNEYATMLRSTGRLNEAVELLRSADPKDPRTGGDPRVALLLAATGDLEGAEEHVKELEVADRVSMNSIRWTIAFWWEDPKTALSKLDALTAELTQADRDCFRTFLKELSARQANHERGLPAACDGADTNWRVRMMAREGDVDGVLTAFDGVVPGRSLLLFYPEMKSVRRDPRFWPLARQMGLVDYWQKSGHWPDFCAEPGLGYDCKTAAKAANATRPPANT